ncbi:MAG TPA: HAD family phosphatase [Pyrinomonadaceae bacterium]|nr:HAD family phosphatase [Pyrinomonadaceae bacterium]
MVVKALLLDFNGVIINDEPIQMRAYQELLAAENIALTDEQYYECLGMDDRAFVEAAYTRVGKTPEPNKVLELMQHKNQKWRDTMSDGIPLFENVENFVRKMAQDFSLGIVSMSGRPDIEYILEQTDLVHCFDVIISTEDVSKCKPDPECYRLGFRELDLARIRKGHLPMIHSECVVIEDSPPGVKAGKAAGLNVLGVTNTVDAQKLRAAGANWIAKDLNDWFPESFRLAFA